MHNSLFYFYSLRTAILLTYLILSCVGYKIYQDEIPNGGSVPHPCKPNYIWRGVGHRNVLGGGDRNPFGLAFAGAGRVSIKIFKNFCKKLVYLLLYSTP